MQINRIFVSHSHIQSARAWRLGVKVCLRSGTYDVLVITSSELLHRGDIATFQTFSVTCSSLGTRPSQFMAWIAVLFQPRIVLVASTFCKEQCSFS